MHRNPRHQLFATLAALALGVVVLAAGSRDEFPGRRQGGGSWNHADPSDLLP